MKTENDKINNAVPDGCRLISAKDAAKAIAHECCFEHVGRDIVKHKAYAPVPFIDSGYLVVGERNDYKEPMRYLLMRKQDAAELLELLEQKLNVSSKSALENLNSLLDGGFGA